MRLRQAQVPRPPYLQNLDINLEAAEIYYRLRERSVHWLSLDCSPTILE